MRSSVKKLIEVGPISNRIWFDTYISWAVNVASSPVACITVICFRLFVNRLACAEINGAAINQLPLAGFLANCAHRAAAMQEEIVREGPMYVQFAADGLPNRSSFPNYEKYGSTANQQTNKRIIKHHDKCREKEGDIGTPKDVNLR